MNNGAPKAIIALGNRRNFSEVPGDIMERLTQFSLNAMTAAMKALGTSQVALIIGNHQAWTLICVGALPSSIEEGSDAVIASLTTAGRVEDDFVVVEFDSGVAAMVGCAGRTPAS